MKQSNQPAPLRDVIAGVHSRLETLRGELREAREEIKSLRGRLATNSIPQAELGSIRRQVSFYCHPDRGGNGLLMRRLNALFDILQGRQ